MRDTIKLHKTEAMVISAALEQLRLSDTAHSGLTNSLIQALEDKLDSRIWGKKHRRTDSVQKGYTS